MTFLPGQGQSYGHGHGHAHGQMHWQMPEIDFAINVIILGNNLFFQNLHSCPRRPI